MTAVGRDYLEAIIAVAEREPTIARVLREISSLDAAARTSALALVGAHLRAHGAAADVLHCVDALGDDALARAIGERLGARAGMRG